MYKNFNKLLGLNKSNLKPYFIVISLIVIISILITHYGDFLSSTFNWLAGAILLVIMFITFIVVGFAVVKALFFVGASLSLLLFISQSYCALPDDSRIANGALQGLLFFGLIYIGMAFIKVLHKEIFGSFGNKNINWLMLVFYIIFIILFLWQIYNVMYPIFSNLCIY